jgi:rhodanese-related sulfurtransferase/DNA-binding transcriptional ArsR family regulator
MLADGNPQRKRRFKAAVYGELAATAGALASAHRLELLELLEQSPRSVQDVAAEAGLSVANASQHLRVLAAFGLVESERRGAFVYYRQGGAEVHHLLVALRDVAVQRSGFVEAVGPYLAGRADGIDDLDALRSLIGRKDVVLLDARPPSEFAAGHLPGAVNAPVAALRAGAVSVLRAKRYLVYCRGPYCTFADEAVALLAARGIVATRVELSPADWSAAGGDLERG